MMSKVVRTSAELPDVERIQACVVAAGIVISRFKAQHVVVEGVSHWANLRSMTAAAKGDLTNLSYIVGGILHDCTRRGITSETVDVRTWKGQLTTRALKAALMRILGRTFHEHEREAVGVGLWKLGKL